MVGFKIISLFCVQSIREEYRDYKEDKQNQILVFDRDQVVLDLPDSPSKVVDGWKILPLTYPQVDIQHASLYNYNNLHVSIVMHANGLFLQITKAVVQNFQSGTPPACTIELKWTGRGKLKCLSHKVEIIGARKPNNYFYMRYSPQECKSLCLYILCVVHMHPRTCISHLLSTATAIAKPLPETRATLVPKIQLGRYMYLWQIFGINLCCKCKLGSAYMYV